MYEFDPLSARLTLDLLKLNLSLVSGQTLRLRVPEGFLDRAEQRATEPFTSSYLFDPARVTQTILSANPKTGLSANPQTGLSANPQTGLSVNQQTGLSAPLIKAHIARPDLSPAGEIKSRLEVSADAPPWAPEGQRHSIQVVNESDGSGFGFEDHNLAYNLRQWPYLLLDYKVPAESPFNLHFRDANGNQHALVLTDTGDGRDRDSEGDILSRFGPPQGFTADGAWHRTIVPLARLFSCANPLVPLGPLSSFSLNDHGWLGNRRAMTYWIQALQALPAARPENLSFTWEAQDLSGITEYASCVDDQPTTDPAGKKEIAAVENLAAALQRRGHPLQDGANYLHVRVRNGLGLWSPPAHYPFYLCQRAPQIVRTEPPAGGTTAGQTFKLFVQDDAVLDPASLRLTVNGVPVAFGASGFSFDPAESAFSYHALEAQAPWPNHTPVKVEVTNMVDLPGNTLQAPFTFSFTAERNAGPGPAIARMRYTVPEGAPHSYREYLKEISFVVDFEEQTGQVHALRDCRPDWLDDPKQAAFGRRAMRFTALDDNADVQILLHNSSWFLDLLPVVQFDYKLDPKMKLDLWALVAGVWMSVGFTGDGSAPAGGVALGRVADVVADSRWRHACVDLRALIDAARPGLKLRLINKIILTAHGQPGTSRGATLTLDNLILSGPNGGNGSFEWEAAPDSTGIAGYSFVIDQDPTAQPPPALTAQQPQAYAGALTGVWFAHVRACNQAGDWGPTRTMKVDFGK